MILGLDFETYSTADLKKVGVEAYAEHPSTGVHCAVFRRVTRPGDTGQVAVWTPFEPALPQWVIEHVRSGALLLAHNAGFERAVWRAIFHRYAPVPRPEQWRDTQLLAAVVGLPRGLEGLAAALGAPPKDMAGNKLMRSVSRVVDGNPPALTPQEWKELIAYCEQDVDTMLSCWWRLPKLSRELQAEVEEHDRINARGVCIDLALARDMSACAARREAEIAVQVFEATGSLLGTNNVPLLTDWLRDHGVVLPKVVRKRADGSMHASESVDRASIAKILKRPDLPANVRHVLLARIESGRMSSLAKAAKAPTVVSRDGRLRNALRFAQATTGRWSSDLLQMHNLARPTAVFKAVAPGFVEAIRALDIERAGCLHPVLEGLSFMLRSMVVAAPGFELVGGDWSAIEARVNAWCAGQLNKVELFRAYDATAGRPAAERREFDPYVRAAADVQSDDRQLGKFCELGLGYGMGAIKFRDTCANNGLLLELKRAREVQRAWRKANPAIVQFWSDIEDACRAAIASPGTPVPVGRVRVSATPSVLMIHLPSGRSLHYWRPHVRTVTKKIETVDDEGNVETREFTVDELRFFTPVGGKMAVEATYGGKLTENVVQAIARDILAAALLRLAAHGGYPVVLHVHDSIVAEVPEGTGSVDEFCTIMSQPPAWMGENPVPLAVDGYRAKHFKG